MRILAVVLAILAWIGFGAERACAEIHDLAKHTVAEVRRACGASFQESLDGGGYGCTKDCKGSDGKTVKNGCAVACDNNNNCKGKTPDRVVPPRPSIRGVLSGFSAGVDAKPPRKPRAGRAAAPRKPAAPAASPSR